MAVKLARVKLGAGLVTCEVTVDASATAAAKVDGVVVNSAFDNARDSMSCSIESGLIRCIGRMVSRLCCGGFAVVFLVCLAKVSFEGR